MQRSMMFLRNQDDYLESDNIIFLDIDGIFKVELAQEHFEHDWDKTKDYIKENYPKYNYDDISLADINATYYTFHMDSVGIFKKLVEDTNAKVVLSSDWRNTKTLYQMKALFHLHDMDCYLNDQCKGDWKNIYYINKEDAIDEYIDRVKPKNYVIIDDYNYFEKYKLNFTKVNNLFSMTDYRYSKIILSNNDYSIDQSYDLINCKVNNYDTITFKCEDFIINNYKIKYLTLYKYNYYDYYIEYIEYFLNKMSFEDTCDLILFDSNINDLIVNARKDYNGLYTFNINNIASDELTSIKRKILSKK